MYFEDTKYQKLSPAEKLRLYRESQKPEEDELLLDPSQFDNAYDQMVAEREARRIGVGHYLASRPKREPASDSAYREIMESNMSPAAKLQKARELGFAWWRELPGLWDGWNTRSTKPGSLASDIGKTGLSFPKAKLLK